MRFGYWCPLPSVFNGRSSSYGRVPGLNACLINQLVSIQYFYISGYPSTQNNQFFSVPPPATFEVHTTPLGLMLQDHSA